MNPPQQTLHSLLLLADAPSSSKLTADDLNQWPDSLRRAVEASAILREEALATWVNCDQCPDGGTGEVYYIKRGESAHAYINCPECGRVPVPLGRLRQYSVDLPGLVAWLTGQLGISTAPTELVRDRLWRLGASAIGKKQRAVCLARGLHWPDAEQAASAFLTSFDGLCITLNPSLILPAWRRDGLSIVPLDQFLRIRRGRLTVDKVELGQIYKSRRKTTPVAVAAMPPPDALLTVGLQLRSRKDNPSFMLVREGCQPAERSLQQAEYAVLLCLAQAMRNSRRRRNQPVKEWGWVKREDLVSAIAHRSKSNEDAASYLTTIVSRLRHKLVSAIGETGLTVDSLRVIENAAPSSAEKRSLYRLAIYPDGLILPRS